MALPIEFPSTTKHFSLPMLFSGQAQKEFFINQSFVVIDALLQHGVIDSLETPPSDASEGQCFRILANATGDWAGHDDELVVRVANAWHFVLPLEGMRVFDRNAAAMLHYNAGWQAATEPTVPDTGSTVDAEARTVLTELIEALRKIGIFANSP
ncbi:MAG: DUF2793 domain-containing protein [Erythrobacter sp.]